MLLEEEKSMLNTVPSSTSVELEYYNEVKQEIE
jgi:hypothetical protein